MIFISVIFFQVCCDTDSTAEAMKITKVSKPLTNIKKYSTKLLEDTEFDNILAHHRDNAKKAASSSNFMKDDGGGGIAFNRQKSMERFLHLEKVLHGDIKNYKLPSGFITPKIAAELVEVYKRGGRLSKESVHKILRLSYRSLKKKKNISRVTLGPYDSAVVVGDIHGKI